MRGLDPRIHEFASASAWSREALPCHSRPERRRRGGEGNPGALGPRFCKNEPKRWIPFPALRAAGDDGALDGGRAGAISAEAEAGQAVEGTPRGVGSSMV